MTRAPAAGLAYGLAIFALGFVLGTLRELVLAPVFGRDAIVLLEAPIILIAAWFTAGWIIRRFDIPGAMSARLVMGAMAFVLLMIGEAGVSVFGFGRTLLDHLAIYLSARGMLELLPQLAFALFPLLHLLRDRSRP